MHHAIHNFWTIDSTVTEGFFSSAPKPSKRTRRPKQKTTPTTEAPQTKLGKCGFMVKGLGPNSFGEPQVDAHGGSESPCEPSVGEGTRWSAAPTVELAKEIMVGGDLCGSWIPCASCKNIFSFNRYFICFFLLHYILLLKIKYLK